MRIESDASEKRDYVTLLGRNKVKMKWSHPAECSFRRLKCEGIEGW